MSSNILFYSKYSARCKELFDLLSISRIDIIKIYSITPICVDNKELREKILSNKKIPVNFVPTLLIFKEGGTVEKYEGEYANTWFRESILEIKPEAFDPIEPIKEEAPPPKKKIQSGSGYVPQSLKNNPPRPKRELPSNDKVRDDELLDIDDIDDTDDTDDTEGIQHTQRIQDIEDIEDIEDIDEIEEIPKNTGKKPNGKIDVNQILAQAQSAQKKREEKFGYKEK